MKSWPPEADATYFWAQATPSRARRRVHRGLCTAAMSHFVLHRRRRRIRMVHPATTLACTTVLPACCDAACVLNHSHTSTSRLRLIMCREKEAAASNVVRILISNIMDVGYPHFRSMPCKLHEAFARVYALFLSLQFLPPLYTTQPIHRYCGVGFSAVHKIVHRHYAVLPRLLGNQRSVRVLTDCVQSKSFRQFPS